MRSIAEWFADRQMLRRQDRSMRDFGKEVCDVYARAMLGEKSPELTRRLEELSQQMSGRSEEEPGVSVTEGGIVPMWYDKLTGPGKGRLVHQLLEDMGVRRIFQAYVSESAFASVVIGECIAAAWHGKPAPTPAQFKTHQGSVQESGADLSDSEALPVGYDQLTGPGKGKLLHQLLEDIGIRRILQAYVSESTFASVVIGECITSTWHGRPAPTPARFENWRGHAG